MGQLEGKVAFVTGAARGQGRSHAVALAEEGADIVGLDICEQIDSVAYPMATQADLDETVSLVEETGRRMIGVQGDVRNRADIQGALDLALTEFRRLDIVLANAGILAFGLQPYDQSEQAFKDSLDVMLTGTWNTLQLVAPILVGQGEGGAIVITCSSVTRQSITTNYDGGFDGYHAAKYAQAALMTGYAGKLAQHNIRINTFHPSGVATPMIMNDFFSRWINENPDYGVANALPVDWMQPAEASDVILFLVGDTGRYVTGQEIFADAGQTMLLPKD